MMKKTDIIYTSIMQKRKEEEEKEKKEKHRVPVFV